MRKLVLAAAVVVPTLALSVFAGDGAEKPTVETLPNGLRIVAREAKGTGLIALVCYVDGGNRTEPAELSGLSHYYEHLVFRGGTGKQKELETRKVFTQLGTFYGFTTEDATCFYFIVPRSSLDEALWRHRDAVTNVHVTEEKVKKEREVVLSEYKMSVADSPWGTVWHELLRTAFEKHAYGRTTIGLREVIETCDLDRFRSFYEARYVPNQMVISVVGDLPAADLVKKVKEHWSDLEAGKASFELGVAEPPQKRFALHVDEREKIAQSYLALGFRTTGAMDAERVVEDVLAEVLAGGDSARLPLALVSERIALHAGAGSPSSKDPGLFTVTLSTEPEKEAAALARAAQVLHHLAAGGVSDEELANAKRRRTTDTIFGGEALKDEAIRYCQWAVAGDRDLGTTYLEKVNRVTKEQVAAAAKRIFRVESATLSVVRPKGGAAPGWEKIVASGLSGEATAGPDALPAKGGPALVEHRSGARLIFEESRRNRVVSCEVKVAGGVLAEPEEKSGVAQLVERCLARGTKRLDRAALALAWDRLAVRISTASGEESTTLSLRATDETFEPALALLGEMLREPAFAADEVEKAREETIQAIDAVEDNSFALTHKAYADALYGAGHPYGRPILGSKKSVTQLSRDDLVRFHEQTFRPERLVVAVVGAIDKGAAQALVVKHLLGSEKAGAPARKPERLVAPPVPRARPGVLVLDRKREQATFNLGLVTVAATDEDFLPIAVASRHLGNQLFFRYVYERGIAYRMWTLFGSGTGARPFTLEMGVSAKNFVEARDGVQAAVRALVEVPLSPDDVARAKQDYVNRLLLARGTSEDRARTLAAYELLGLGFDWEGRLPERLERVTSETISKALARRLDVARMTLTVVGDRAALEAAGAKLEPPLDDAGPY